MPTHRLFTHPLALGVVLAGLLALAYLAAKTFYEKRPSSGMKVPEVAQTNPVDVDKLALVRSLLESRDPSRIPEIQATLSALAMQSGEVGAAALFTGLASGVVPPESLADWSGRLRVHPYASSSMKLLADSIYIRCKPEERKAVVMALFERMQKAPFAERLDAAYWLVDQGMPSQVGGMVGLNEVLKNGDAFLLWLNAHALTNKQWSEILAALQQPGNPLPAHVSNLHAGRALKMLGQPDQSAAAYMAACLSVADNPEELLNVFAWWEENKEPALFDQATIRLLNQPATAVASMRALVPAVQKSRDSERLLLLYQRAASTPPLDQNPTVQNDLAYLNLLMGTPVDLIQLQKRNGANPRDLSSCLTLSFAHLRKGDPALALKTIESFGADVDLGSLAPQQKLIIASVFSANGRRDDARHVASLISLEQLSQQESAFLQTALANPESLSQREPKKRKDQPRKK